MTTLTVFYVADPMCSWCWGFRDVLRKILEQLPQSVGVRYVMGGLAPDSDESMPDETREYIQGAWRQVSVRTGAQFNWDFWTTCQPRHSTYPACRAVLAAHAVNGSGPAMFDRIQQAYYLEARNPSDAETLVALAGELGIDREQFRNDLKSPQTENLLQKDFRLQRELGCQTFPSLVLENNGERQYLTAGYDDFERIRARLQ